MNKVLFCLHGPFKTLYRAHVICAHLRAYAGADVCFGCQDTSCWKLCAAGRL